MGRRGPAPLPSNVTKMRGTNRPGRSRNEPKPRPIAPPCPRWLDQMARAEWHRVAPELERLGLLTEVDGTALAAYCDAYARWRKARAILATKGLTFTTKTGYTQQRPEVAILNTAMTTVRQFCQEFGLTPSARARIQVPEPEGDGEEDLD